MKTLNRIKICWLVPLFMALALFRPLTSFALDYTLNFSWLELIPPGYRLDSWSFDEGTNFDSDFGFPPLSCSNVVQVPDWDGNALQVDSTNAAWLTYGVTEYAPGYGEYTNLTLQSGSIEFMFAPNWQSADTNYYGSGPGDWGRFVDIGTWDTNIDSDWWSLYLNPSGTAIYFSSGTNGIRTNYLNAPISWDSTTWHMIVLTFSPSNSFIYLDGQLAVSGDGVRYVPSGSILTNGFAVGSDFATGMQQVHGQIDDLYTYNYQLSAADVAGDYADISPELPGTFHAMDDGVPFPGGGGGSGGGYTNEFFGIPLPDYGTNLWLEMTNAINGQASGWVHNTSLYVPYTIFSRQSLLWPIWSPEITLYGTYVTNSTPFQVSMLARTNLFLEARSEIAPRIIGGGNTQFATLRRDGTVWTWGDGEDGQLGNGQWTNSSTPVQVTGLSNIVAIAVPATGDYTLALDSCGKVWSWGDNSYGQLGRDDDLYENENTPAIIPGLSNIVAIAGGSGHAIALRSDGTVWAWGDNAYGDLGDNSNDGRDDAEPVSGLTNAIAIASGDCHCFAICANGTVLGWGLNEDWELGIGNADDQWLPVPVTALTNTVALSGGYDFSIALLANGKIEAWGANYDGEIGAISSSTPVPVPGLSNIVSIASGGVHSLFINTSGNFFAWGWDWQGQFGDNGANDGSTVPYLLTTVSNVTAIAGGAECSIISTGNGNVYTFGDSYEYESGPILTDIYTNYSSDGSGLPDWWEFMYFGYLGLNPSSDPVGDGWTLLQDYQDGFNPTNFITPPAITGLTVTQTNGQNGATLTWNAETPTPLDYTIYRLDYNIDTWQYGSPQEIGEVANNITTFTDNGSVTGGGQYSVYEVFGVYGGGTSSVSQGYINASFLPTLTDNIPFNADLIRNGTGRWQIMFSGIPNGIQTIRLLSYLGGQINGTEDISVSNFVNNAYGIPDSDVLNYLGSVLYVQGIGPDGLPGQEIYAGAFSPDAPYFVNGQQDIDQNLSFLIQAASMNHDFGYYGYPDGQTEGQLMQSATNFEEFSFLHHNNTFPGNDGYDTLDNLWPFEKNYDFANNFPDTTRTNEFQSAWGTNSFNFQPNFATNIPAAPILSADPYYILQPGFGLGTLKRPENDEYAFTSDWGIDVSNVVYFGILDTGVSASMQSGIKNLFGLSYGTGYEIDMIVQDTGALTSSNTYAYPYNNFYLPFGPGDSWVAGSNPVETNQWYVIGSYASLCSAPTFDFVNYYFGPLMNTNVNATNLPPVNQQPYPLPIDDNFNITNQTPSVILGAVGQPMILGAWAKYSVQGSSPTKYAYQGQYFTTNAWEMNSAGNMTSTNAGIVSPYGEFFPTQPGPAALITTVNPDTEIQATGIVNVISLAVDANHDGTIDPTWNGPDFTSLSHPYIFWANNNFDRWDYDSADKTNYMDDVQSGDGSDLAQNLDPNDPDCNYNIDGIRVIPDTRDLEDFARLWVCGITSNLLAKLPAGSTVTLSWGDVGNPNPNNPTIDLFAAADPDGGIGYQTNETIANEQIDISQCPWMGRLGPGSNIVLNTSYFANNWAGNYFIWDGVSNGTGGLTLTITGPNSNVLAQTTAYIQIEDIKQMYERWTVGDETTEDDTSVVPATIAQLATNDLPLGISEPFQYVNPPSTNTPYVLYVHGWNMSAYDKDRFAETAFKRLYWQGYQGRFGSFRWPTGFGFGGWLSILTDPDNFDNSEFNAWRSGAGLLNKLMDLNSQYPGSVYVVAHSMGNIVTGEALRLAGTNIVVNTYVASQAALSAHCYDPTTPDQYVDSIPDCYAQYWTNGAPCYFNGIKGAGTFVNFFNTNDYALNLWTDNEDIKPDTGYHYEALDGLFVDGLTELYFPTNTYQIFAYADPAESYALGAQTNVSGVFEGSQEDLKSVWVTDPLTSNPNNQFSEHFWHSAEFRGDLPQQINYWKTILGPNAFNLQ